MSESADDELFLERCNHWIELRTWGWLCEVLHRGSA
jgi:hypothetical protein